MDFLCLRLMLHGHNDCGKVPVSNTSIGKTPLKSVHNECLLFFSFQKKNLGMSQTRSQQARTTQTWQNLERERENSIWTNTSLFPLVLGSDLCGVLSWSRLVTTKPPPAFGDPKAPSLSFHCFSLCRYQVLCLLGFRLFLSLFLLLLFFFFWFYVYLLMRVQYWVSGFSVFFLIFLMGLVMEQKLYFGQHFFALIVLIWCYYFI